MILDNLKNAGDYIGLSANFKKAFEFLTSNDLTAMQPGRYEIDGDNVYVMIQECALKPWSEGIWEAHRKYADIQTVICGAETIGYRMDDGAEEPEEYSDEKDVLFCRRASGDSATLHEGDFMVLMPQDFHRPCIQPESGETQVRKAVVKVALS